MNIKTIRKIASFCLAVLTAAMTFCVVSCGDYSNEASSPEPEMAYPLLTEKSFNGSDEQESEDIYEYDAEGHLIRAQQRLLGEATTVSTYQYENGKLVRLTKKEEYNETSFLWEYKYKYDANGLLQEISESENGEYAGKTSYLRDGSGKIKRVIYYNENGGFDGMVEHKYDDAGNCIEEKEYDAQSMISRYIYQYDQSGHVTECRMFDKQGVVYTYRFEYGSGGELLRQSWLDGNGNVYRVEEYSFDEDGRRKSWTDTKDGAIVRIVYYDAYDENGNCVKESAYDWNGGSQDENPAWYLERAYGTKKVPVAAWELKDCRFHGDFLL